MRRFVPASALVLGTTLVIGATAQPHSEARPSDSLDTPFSTGGRISMDLSAGGYRVSAGPDDRIRVEWTVRRQHELRDVDADVEVDGSDATVVVDNGPRSGFHVDIEVPRRADLTIRLSAGELSVEEIVGDKDIRLHAGELRIDVGDADDYRRVESSVWAGELQAEPFRTTTGGLFRSLDWRGAGEFLLRAHLKAGELRLY